VVSRDLARGLVRACGRGLGDEGLRRLHSYLCGSLAVASFAQLFLFFGWWTLGVVDGSRYMYIRNNR